jgi:hypothetical protein
MSQPFPTETLPFRALVRYWLIAIGVLLGIGFVLFQARFLITGPQILLFSTPKSPTNERVITLEGRAQNISRIWLNDRPIFTNATGDFREEIVLENGYTIATLRAEDRYGRTTVVAIPLVYVPASLAPTDARIKE